MRSCLWCCSQPPRSRVTCPRVLLQQSIQCKHEIGVTGRSHRLPVHCAGSPKELSVMLDTLRSAMPRVCTVIIFLNAENFIDEAIASVFAQTYDDWELVLVDDGSSDASTAIAKD